MPWLGDWLLREAVEKGEGLWAAEARLSAQLDGGGGVPPPEAPPAAGGAVARVPPEAPEEALQEAPAETRGARGRRESAAAPPPPLRGQEEEERRRRAFGRRAAVRLRLGLYDAALADAEAAADAPGAAAARLAANAGLGLYRAALYGERGGAWRPGEAQRQRTKEEAQLNAEVRRHVRRLEEQSGGAFDWQDVYWPPSGAPALLPPVAEYVGPVQAAPSPQRGGGRALRAVRAVEPGELLLCSCALVRVDADRGEAADACGPLAAYRRAAAVSQHACFVLGEGLSDGSRRPVLPLARLAWRAPRAAAGGGVGGTGAARPPAASPLEDDVLHGAIATNAFKDLGHSIFPAVSLANHSCLPNALLVHLGEALMLRARRPLAAGEEVTISYFDVLQPLALRARRCRSWGFDCRCRRCEAEAAVRTEEFAVPRGLSCDAGALGAPRAALDGPSEEDGVGPALAELERAVARFVGWRTPEARWVCAGFASLYGRQARETGSTRTWQELLRLHEEVTPASFLHCQLLVLRWRARANDGEVVLREAAWGEDRGGSVAEARVCCEEAHRLRYGPLAGEGLSRLLGETRRALETFQGEFCGARWAQQARAS